MFQFNYNLRFKSSQTSHPLQSVRLSYSHTIIELNNRRAGLLTKTYSDLRLVEFLFGL